MQSPSPRSTIRPGGRVRGGAFTLGSNRVQSEQDNLIISDMDLLYQSIDAFQFIPDTTEEKSTDIGSQKILPTDKNSGGWVNHDAKSVREKLEKDKLEMKRMNLRLRRAALDNRVRSSLTMNLRENLQKEGSNAITKLFDNRNKAHSIFRSKLKEVSNEFIEEETEAINVAGFKIGQASRVHEDSSSLTSEDMKYIDDFLPLLESEFIEEYFNEIDAVIKVDLDFDPLLPSFQEMIECQEERLTDFMVSLNQITLISDLCIEYGHHAYQCIRAISEEIRFTSNLYANDIFASSIDTSSHLIGIVGDIQLGLVKDILTYIRVPLKSFLRDYESTLMKQLENWHHLKKELSQTIVKYFKKITLTNHVLNKELEKELEELQSQYIQTSFALAVNLQKNEVISKVEFVQSITAIINNVFKNFEKMNSYESLYSQYYQKMAEYSKKSVNAGKKHVHSKLLKKPEMQIFSKKENPEEKCGHLMYKISSGRRKWTKGYFTARNGNLTMHENDQVLVWDLFASSVKMSVESKKCFSFEIISFNIETNTSDSVLLQAKNEEDRSSWIQVITNIALRALSDQDVTKEGLVEKIDVSETTKNSWKLKNPKCVDCGMDNPEWCAINLGVMMCLNCSGVHREMGTEHSKIRSMTLDQWEVQSIEVMNMLDNVTVNRILVAALPDNERIFPDADRDTRTAFIRAKYIYRNYLEDSDLPPEILDQKLLQKSSAGAPLSEILKMLLLGADIDTQNEKGQTALILAISSGHSTIAQLLLTSGASVSLSCHLGNTPLHYAISQNNEDIIISLISKGANPIIANISNITALELATNANISKLLIEKIALVSTRKH